MQIIYQTGQFRITLVRELSRFAGDAFSTTRTTPFLLTYRAPGALSAEQRELTDRQFERFLHSDALTAKTLNALQLEPMSEGMLMHLLLCPTKLQLFVVPESAKATAAVKLEVESSESLPVPTGITLTYEELALKVALLQRFINRARAESELVTRDDLPALLVPYWFMQDEPD